MKTKSLKTTTRCPKCESTNIIRNGTSQSGKEQVKCRDCNQFSTLGVLPSLASLTCTECGKLGVHSRKSMLCNNCYVRQKRQPYQYDGRIRKVLSKKEKTYYKNHLKELPVRLNLTMKQRSYFSQNPDKWEEAITKLLT